MSNMSIYQFVDAGQPGSPGYEPKMYWPGADAIATPNYVDSLNLQPDNTGAYMMAAGGGFSAMSTLLASQQSARLLRANATIAGLQGQSENQAGAEQAELYRQHLDATLGKQAAEVGGSNVTMTGSPLRALSNTAQLGAQDISRIQVNASRKAWGYQQTEQGDLVRASQASDAGVMNTFGGLITTGAKAFGMWNFPKDGS